MKTKKGYAQYGCLLVFTGLLLVLFSLAGCEIITGLVDGSREFFHDPPVGADPPDDPGDPPPLSPLAGKMFTKVTIAPNINNQIRLRPNGDLELGYHEAYDSIITLQGFKVIYHTNTDYTDYWPLIDFLLSPGVENHDVIRFNSEGKIDYIYKDFEGVSDLEIVIGTTHGTTAGTGQLDPALFASNVQLSGWPLVYTQAGVSHNGYTVKISGGNLASGTQLAMLPWFDFSYTIPYIIYGTTYNIVNYTGNVYTYP
jgi:hypothetical protein